ncbi:MAG: flippase [Ignavibacteriales bacterium]|nr:flippase [Ignavibacteriales bacterium]
MNHLKKEKTLIENIFSLSFIQFLNYLFPFITFPYLVRVLGVEKFGLINFAAAFIGYFILITDYGFNISAVRLVSIHRDEKQKLSELISSVYIIKIILFVISVLVFILVSLSNETFRTEFQLYAFTFLSVIGNIFLPVWFYQGIEKTKYVAVVTLLIRTIWVIAIFLFVKESGDYILLALLNSLQSILIGLILFVLLFRKFGVEFSISSFEIIKEQLKDGGMIFISSCAISLYTISNTFILGLLTSNTIVGYFAAADKIRQAIQNILFPFTQAMYPHVSKLFNESKLLAKKFVMKSLKYIGGFSFLISFLTFMFAKQLVLILVGDNYLQSVNVLRIISFLPFIIYLSNLFGIQTMLNLKFNKEFTLIISLAALVNIALSFLLIPLWKEAGSAVAVLLTEIVVTGSIVLFLSKKGFFKPNEI